jgi:hypothetical protein
MTTNPCIPRSIQLKRQHRKPNRFFNSLTPCIMNSCLLIKLPPFVIIKEQSLATPASSNRREVQVARVASLYREFFLRARTPVEEWGAPSSQVGPTHTAQFASQIGCLKKRHCICLTQQRSLPYLRSAGWYLSIYWSMYGKWQVHNIVENFLLNNRKYELSLWCRIWGAHNGGCVEYNLLRYNAV